ncbi:MAG TPA: cupin, partial [Dyella sp.]
CPPGGPEHAHQIINTGTVELRYLAVSTKQTPEICEYPDTGKYGVLAEYPPAADGSPQSFRVVNVPGSSVDYWEGE